MKFRNGFVSNSSSSSYIIVGPRKPTKAELMVLFGVVPETLSGRLMEQIVDMVHDAADVDYDNAKELLKKNVENTHVGCEYVGIMHARNYNNPTWAHEALYEDGQTFVGTYGEWTIRRVRFA